MASHELNVGTLERWASVLGGIGLAVLALRRGGSRSPLVSRVQGALLGATASSLITRGATGYCAAKQILTGRNRTSAERTAPSRTRPAHIGSLAALFASELEELHSAETQLDRLLESLPRTLRSVALGRLLGGYRTEISSRREDLERLLPALGAKGQAHSDQAMHSLIAEVRKMERICAPAVRDAALLACLQRLIHVKIAAYGTVASYAKLLEQPQHASRFAEYADRDRSIDRELSSLAGSLLNPAARASTPEPIRSDGPPH